jgi:GNAT superfamily N-acetyltransferase
MDIRISPARFPEDAETVRGLFREYERGLEADLCFQGFEAELAALPGVYAAPAGRVLLAWVDGEAVGCGAFKDLGEGICEMKRLFVRPTTRGLGLGRRLCDDLLDAARAQGYVRMRLDTLDRLAAALALYQQLGFRPVPAYYANPLQGVVYLERPL